MSIQLYNAFVDILKLPYHKNDHSTSGKREDKHEYIVAETLEKHGFVKTEFVTKLTKGFSKLYKNSNYDNNLWPEIPIGSLVLQPCGTQSYPDILVRDFNGEYYVLECKSSAKRPFPMWNDSAPANPNGIYIFTYKNTDSTTIFLGKDVITAEELATFKLQLEEFRQIEKKYGISASGFKLNCRPQYNQKGNLMTHPDRSKREQAVLDFVKQ